MTGSGAGPGVGSGEGGGANPDKYPQSQSSRPLQAVFLERQSYRRRRLVDVARLLPLLGVLLLLIPLLWPGSGAVAVANGSVPSMPMSRAFIYVFSIWAILIAGAGLFGIAVRAWGGDEHRDEHRDGHGTEPGRD